MSMDRSLKSKASLVRHRNVLTRAERLKVLQEQERWTEDGRPTGLPKVAHRKAPIGGKTKKAAVKEGEAAAAPGATGASAAADAGKKPDAGKKADAGKKDAKK